MSKLTAHLDQKPFNDIPPAKDWNESFARAKQSVKSMIKKRAGEKQPKDSSQPLLENPPSQDP